MSNLGKQFVEAIPPKVRTLTAFGSMAASMYFLNKAVGMSPEQASQAFSSFGGGVLALGAKDLLPILSDMLKEVSGGLLTDHLNRSRNLKRDYDKWIENNDLTNVIGLSIATLLISEAKKYPQESDPIEYLAASVEAKWAEFQGLPSTLGEDVQSRQLPGMFLQPITQMRQQRPVSTQEWLAILKCFKNPDARTEAISEDTLQKLAQSLEGGFSTALFDVLPQIENQVGYNKAVLAILGEGFSTLLKAVGDAGKENAKTLLALKRVCKKVEGLAEKLDIQQIIDSNRDLTKSNSTLVQTNAKLVEDLQEKNAKFDQLRDENYGLKDEIYRLNLELVEAKGHNGSNVPYLTEKIKELEAKLEANESLTNKLKAERWPDNSTEIRAEADRLDAEGKGSEGKALFQSRDFPFVQLKIQEVEYELDKTNPEEALRVWLLAKNYAEEPQLLQIAQVFHDVAIKGFHTGSYFITLPLQVEALSIRQQVLGAEHPDTLISMNNLAGLYWAQGLYAQAEPLYVETLRLRRQVLGAEHPDTLMSMSNLALLSRSQGLYAEAEHLNVEALRLHQQVLGAEHPSTLTSMNNLAGLYESRGLYSQAEPLYVETLRLCQQVLGVEHPKTLTIMNNLAALYDSQGRYSAAEPLYVETLRLRQQVQGAEHPNTLTSMNNLAELYRVQGLYAKAEPLYVETLRLSQQVLGTEHPDTLLSMNNLAILYDAQGRYAEAEHLNVEALRLHQQVLGAEHPSTLTSMNNLAGLYESRGLYSQAEPLFVETLRLCQQVLGVEHLDTLTSMNNLAALYYSQGLYAQAEPLYVETLRLRQQVLGNAHPDTLLSMNNLVALYHDQGKSEECVALLREAERLSRYLSDGVQSRKMILSWVVGLGIQLDP